MTLTDLEKKAKEISEQAQALEFTDVELPQLFVDRFQAFIESEAPSGYKKIEWAVHSAKITTSKDKVIFLPNIALRMAAILAQFVRPLETHRAVFARIFGHDSDVALDLKKGKLKAHKERIDQHFTENGLSEQDKTNFLIFVSDYDKWGGGKTVDRNDFSVSALLKAGNMLAETSVVVAELAKILASEPNLLSSIDENSIQDPSVSSTSLALSDATVTLPKPFILLAGISGTGKTRFVIEQAKRSANGEKNLCIVAVRPDWHEPSDLLGYVSRITGEPVYVATDMLRFIVKAWQRIAPDASTDGLGKFDLSSPPYWLCLDEMNLAPVEQYFADYLSALETRKLSAEGYSCEALVSKSLISLDDEAMCLELGLESDSKIWAYFSMHGIAIPPNLIVAGTVNMDETTHSFSRKVIDRAVTLDFGEFFPNDASDFFAPKQQSVTIDYPTISQASSSNDVLVRNNVKEKTTVFFTELNSVLKNTPFELGFRALNELLLTVISFRPSGDDELQAAWDDFLMMKVLPRIEGDEDKLTNISSKEYTDVLEAIEPILVSNLKDIWDGERKDFFRISTTGGGSVLIQCRSREKLEWMRQRLAVSSYTSFWP